MTHADQRQHVIDFFKGAHAKFISDGIRLVTLKGADYSPESIAMTEAFFTAADINTDVPQVLWVHVRKHLSAIQNHMAGVALRSEDIRSRYLDVANYMALIDSYEADPVRWLRHLDILIQTEQFPNREPHEVEFLSRWMRHQLRKHNCLEQGVNPLATALADTPLS